MSEHKAGLLEVPEAEYHADRSTLSVSGAKKLLDCPARFRYIIDNPVHKDTFDFGHVAHELILGKGAGFRVLQYDSYRSKDARDERDQAYADGFAPILAAEYEHAKALADAVKAHPDASAALTHGRAETAMYGIHHETGIGLRGRADWITQKRDGTAVVVDIKTCVSASPDAVDRAMNGFGYAMQAAWYIDLLAQNGYPDAEFWFVFAEKTAPHLVSVNKASEDVINFGRAKNEIAIGLYAECVKTGHWPAYPTREAQMKPWDWKDIEDHE